MSTRFPKTNLYISILVLISLLGWTSPVSAVLVSLNSVADATIYEEGGDLANGSGDFIFAGNNRAQNQRRAFVRFDVSVIPAGATINSATLVLEATSTTLGNQTINVHKVTSVWSEGPAVGTGTGQGQPTPASAGDATWVFRIWGTTQWTTIGGDFEASGSAGLSVGGNGTYSWTSAQLAADVQDWLDNPSNNRGFILIGNESTGQTAKRFNSRENASNGPMLTVDFTPQVANDATSVGELKVNYHGRGPIE